jgi:4-amino-4-deoxy-L-arabinose transferase-like glycosyltransferase
MLTRRYDSRTVFRVLVACFALVPFVAVARFLNEPFDYDESVYAVVARGMLHGSLPYRDLFDHKPPGIYFWFLASFGLFGETTWGIRIAGAAAFSAALLGTVRSARLLWPQNFVPATVAAGAMAVVSLAALEQPLVNTEPVMLAALMWSFALSLQAKRDENSTLAVASGVLAALACLTKPVAAPNLLLLLVLLGWRRESLYFAAGVAAPVLALTVALFSLGALGDAVYANLHFNSLYAADISWPERLAHLQQNSLVVAFYLAPLVLGAIAGLLVVLQRRERSDIIALGWFAASVLGVAATGRFYAHYFVQLIPALALLSAAAIAPLGVGVMKPRVRVALAGSIAAALVIAASLHLPAYTAEGDVARAAAKEGPALVPRSAEIAQVATYLSPRMKTDDEVMLFGRETQLLWLLDRPSASRFIFDIPLWLDPQNLIEFEADIRSGRALYVVDWVDALSGSDTDPRVAEVRSTIAGGYSLEAQFGAAKVYRRNGP